MKILLTNDDGINAKGIKVLEEQLKKYGEVYVVAPTYHQSGASMSFSLNRGFQIIKYDDHHYSIDGTPVDVVLLAVQILDIKFDLLVSGCNSGHNISYDTLYSGTVGACLEGLNRGIKSMAVSTDYNHFHVVKHDFPKVMDFILENNLLSLEYALNVNFPSNEFNSIKGIQIAQEVVKKDIFYMWDEPDGRHTDRKEVFDTNVFDSDVYLIRHGYVSIVPIINTHFKKDIYTKYKYLKKEF